MRKQITFFRNWFQLAEAQKDDARRLAYYDAIMRYAFEGVEPEEPKTKKNGTDWAEYYAFLTVQPVIDSAGNESRFQKAARARWNASHDATHDMQRMDATHECNTDNATHDASLEKNRIEKNRKEKTNARGGAREGFRLIDLIQVCTNFGATADFARRAYAMLNEAGWVDERGAPIKDLPKYLEAVWNAEQRALAAQPDEPRAVVLSEADL